MGALAFFSAGAADRTAGSALIFRALLVAVAGFSWCAPAAADSVYRWVDQEGVTHISSARPPGNIKAERIDLASTASRRTAAANSPRSTGAAAQREAVLANLRERECVYAIESLDRITSGATSRTPNAGEGSPIGIPTTFRSARMNSRFDTGFGAVAMYAPRIEASSSARSNNRSISSP